VSENDLDSIKNLQKLIKICRKEGIRNFKGIGFEFTLEEPPTRRTKHSNEKDEIAEPLYTEDQALFWSSSAISEVN